MNWRPNTEEPGDNAVCNVYIERGMATDAILVGIVYKKNGKGFLDLFGSAEAGPLYALNKVSGWNEEKIAKPKF